MNQDKDLQIDYRSRKQQVEDAKRLKREAKQNRKKKRAA